jgi:energy-coupling factor transport system permease protein
MLPILCGGLLLGMTTSLEKLVTGLGRLGMPAGMRYTIMVAMRYIATLGSELRQVLLAMRVRGVLPSWQDLFGRPGRTLRILLVPLLIRSFKVVDRMGAAAELRGLSRPGNRLELAEVEFDADDQIFLAANIAVVISLWGASSFAM